MFTYTGCLRAMTKRGPEWIPRFIISEEKDLSYDMDAIRNICASNNNVEISLVNVVH